MQWTFRWVPADALPCPSGYQRLAFKCGQAKALWALYWVFCASLYAAAYICFKCTGTIGIYATHDFALGAQPQCPKYACDLHDIEVCDGMNEVQRRRRTG